MLITNINADSSLLNRLENLIAGSDEMRVLVGFFYFWGIGALHEGLSKNKDLRLKILVGLEAESHAGKIVEFAGDAPPEASDEELRKDFLAGLRSAMRGREMDTQSYMERVSLFIDLVRSGQIEIRKTREPNHAKLYHFALNKTFAKTLDRNYCWITGSSNMTRPGLREQIELNVQLLDFGGEDSRRFFDELWKTSVPLTDDPDTKSRMLEIAGGNESLVADVTPFEAYALVLKSYLEHRELVDKTDSVIRIFAEPKDEYNEPKFRPLTYQVDAINQALSILREYNGVIVADVVGLGKSVVASVLGRVNAKRGLVIVPPRLVGNRMEGTEWWGYLQDFGLNGWEVVSRGMMEETLELVNRQRDFELVVVDEAHYFRNQDSEDYHYLSQICRGKQVVLLTATPFSNRPGDMFALLKLFSPTRQSLLTPDGNLEALFRGYQIKYIRLDYVLKHLKDPLRADKVADILKKLGIALDPSPANFEAILKSVKAMCKALGNEIRLVVEPVMIRRNRLDLMGDPDYSREVARHLSKLHDPVEQFYALTPEQSSFYDLVIRDYFGEYSKFTGAIYQPGAYMPGTTDADEGEDDYDDPRRRLNNQQRNMYKFIRRLLVRRFESSFGAFAKTLDNLIRVHRSVRRLATPEPLGRGIVVLDRNLMDKLLNMEDATDDEVAALLQRYEATLNGDCDIAGRRNMQIFRVSKDFDEEGRQRFQRDLVSDIHLLEKVKQQVEQLDLVANDPKATQLVDEIRLVLDGSHPCIPTGQPQAPQRKILVFTEFQDTVAHLQTYLERAFPGRLLTVGSMSKSVASTVRANFDASCNPGLQRDQFRILLSTDKMSEGLNLNRAGLVINYDIPWNPTRVIQRVGRINRIGIRVFDDLYLFNFFPTEQGAREHNVRQIATNKMFMIHTSIGEDSKILAADEEPTPAGLFAKLSRNPELLEEESFITRAKRAWRAICAAHPEVVEKIAKLPPRVKSSAAREPSGVYLFARKGMTLFALYKPGATGAAEEDTPVVHLSLPDALTAISCPFETKRLRAFSDSFWSDYEILQSVLSERRHGGAPGATSLITKAQRVLLDNIAKGAGDDFAKTLLDDLQNHGTLSERTLRKIVETAGSTADFVDLLVRLRAEMGANYLSAIKDKLPNGEIVIAIEHRPA